MEPNERQGKIEAERWLNVVDKRTEKVIDTVIKTRVVEYPTNKYYIKDIVYK